MLMSKENMSGRVCAAFYFLSFIVVTASAAEVYLIDANSKNGNVHKLTMSVDNKLVLEPVTSDDLKGEAAKIFELYKRPDNQELSNKQHRIFGNMFGSPTKLKSFVSKKYRRPRHDMKHQMKSLEPIIKYLLNQQNSNAKYNFHDLTKKEKPEKFAEDYVDFGDFSRVQSAPDFSQDYIDFRFLRSKPKAHRLRRATDVVKEALERAYGDSDEDSDDEEDEDTKLKRFEVVKNKHNKKDIKSDSDEATEEDDGDKTKKSKENNLDSDQDFSELSDKERKPKKAKKKESEENNEDERPELYLQGNKLTVYPPAQGDSVEADSDEDSRRNVVNRRMRLPYFLPKRYHWTQKDIPNLGYYFFNGPKGISQETD